MNKLKIKRLNRDITICTLNSPADADLSKDFYFLSSTSRETTLVCNTDDVPANTVKRSDGWKACVIDEELEFSKVGIMAELSGILEKKSIPLYALSSYSTDYILVKELHFEEALFAFAEKGYEITN